MNGETKMNIEEISRYQSYLIVETHEKKKYKAQQKIQTPLDLHHIGLSFVVEWQVLYYMSDSKFSHLKICIVLNSIVLYK